jgi:hypothetical protein
MHYNVTVGFETENLDKDGNPKMKKSRYLVEAMSVAEAMGVISNYCSEDMRRYEVLTINKAMLEDVIDMTNKPQYYKG